MHRINTKRKQTILLRILAYTTIVVLSTLTTVVLLYVALGYRLDGSSGHVVRTGLLLVKNNPVAAEIYINNELKDNAAPGRFTLSAGSYELGLRQAGYREWKKTISVAASGVREVIYPILIPTTLTTKEQIGIETPSLVSQSNDRKLLLTHVTNRPTFELFELSGIESKHESVPIAGGIKRENGQTGTFKAVEWALDNKHVLLEQTLPSGALELISIDVTKPSEARSVTALYGGKPLVNPHYAGENTDAVYGVRDGSLYLFNFEKTEETLVLGGVRNYAPYGNDTILYDRVVSDQAEAGIWKDGKLTKVHVAASQSASLLAYGKYNDYYYFAVAEPALNKVTIYRDPLKNPLPQKQSPFVSIAFENPERISFGSSGQFLLVQSGRNLITYDCDEFKTYAITLPFDLADGTHPIWLNATHLTVQGTDGANYLLEYDGQNMQALLPSKVGTPLFLSSDLERLYRMVAHDLRVGLEAGSMLVE